VAEGAVGGLHMGDGSVWGMLGQWVTDPEHRTLLWSGIGIATMFVLGIIGVLTESPSYEQGVDTSGEGGGPGVPVLFGLLILLGVVSVVLALFTPSVRALPGAALAQVVVALLAVFVMTRFVWKRGVWWRVVGAVLVAFGLWAWFAPGQVAAVWALVMPTGMTQAAKAAGQWFMVPENQGNLFLVTSLLGVTVANVVMLWWIIKHDRESIGGRFYRAWTWKWMWAWVGHPFVLHMFFLALSLVWAVGSFWVAARIAFRNQ
jgi:hypothetical protein